MNKTINKIKNSALAGIGFGVGLLVIIGVTYAYTSVSSGETLTATMWNNLQAKVDGINTDGSGNVGIGTETPGAKLHVEGGVSPGTNNGQLRVKGVLSSNYWDIFHNANSTNDYGLTFRDNTGDIYLTLDNGGNSYFTTGNVGIGTTNPTEKLEVNGNIKAQNSIKAYASFNGENGVTIYDSYGISSIVRNSAGNYTVTWSTPFANRNYIITGSCNMLGTAGAQFGLEGNAKSGDTYEGLYTTSAQIGCRISTNANGDSDLIHFTVIGQQ